MRRFQFRLQKLLDIRGYKEKQVKNEMAGARRRRNLLVEKKEKFLKEAQKSRKKMRVEENQKKLTIERFNQYQRYFKRLRVNVKTQDKLISLADEEINLINSRLVQARKDKRVLERLKENKLKEYLYELQKEDQDFFDEVGNNSFIKKKIEEEELPAGQEVKEKLRIPTKYRGYAKNITEQL